MKKSEDGGNGLQCTETAVTGKLEFYARQKCVSIKSLNKIIRSHHQQTLTKEMQKSKRKEVSERVAMYKGKTAGRECPL